MKNLSLNLNFILSLFAGALTTLLVGVLLFPLIVVLYESIFAGRTYDSSFWSSFKWNDLVFILSAFAWVFIATAAGGLTCTLISKTNCNIQLLILILSVLALSFFYLKITPRSALLFISLTAIYTAGYFTGNHMASAIKTRRHLHSR